MRFARRARRRLPESVVPMINVVFLLLVFFLLTARIAPAPPFDVTLPDADATTPPEAERILHLGADGTLALEDARGAAVWAALGDGTGSLTVRADADLPAAELARILSRLAAAGITDVTLTVRPR